MSNTAAYVFGDEGARLRIERDGCGPGSYEHTRVYGRWSEEEAAKLTGDAHRIISDRQHHADHHDDWSDLARSSCAVCVLNGYDEHTSRGALMPNYAGWARIFVQAGVPIPAKYRDGFEVEANDSEYESYARALGRDIATFGVRFV